MPGYGKTRGLAALAAMAIVVGACAEGQSADTSADLGAGSGAGADSGSSGGGDSAVSYGDDDSDAGGGSDAAHGSDGGGHGDAAGGDAGHGGDAAGSDASSGGDAGGTDSGGGCVTVGPNHLCGLTPQCGCTSGSTCDVTNASTGAATCVAAGTTTAGGACSTTGDCAAGLSCRFDACRAYCTSPGSTCGGAAGTLCFAPQDAQGNTTPNLDVCTVACNPRVPNTVCGTLGCVWFPTDAVTDCRLQGSGLQTDACTYAEDCHSGYTCATHPVFGAECERWCRRGVAGDCSSGYTCAAFPDGTAPVVSSQTLGVCQD